MNVDNDTQKTPLTAASEEKLIEIRKSLVDSLEAAIENKHTEICKLLIEAGAVNFKKPNDRELRGILKDAVKKGLIDIVKMIIDKAPNIDVNDYDGYTPLMAAVGNGNVEIFKLLVEVGADLDKQTDCYDGDTPLMYAVSNGELEISKLLIEAGADLDKKNEDGYTALMRATKGEVENRNSFDETDQTIEICQLLVEAGADLDKKSKEGYTALILAAKEGHKNICDILLTAGADAKITCICKEMWYLCNRDQLSTACDIAMFYDCDEVVAVFENHGETSNINIRKQLKSAAKDGRIDITKKIIEERPDVDVDDFICTPLMSATKRGANMAMFKLLIEAGADPLKNNEYDDWHEYDGYSPLKYAAENGKTEIVKIFLEKVPNMNRDNYKQNSPLMIATEERHTEICKSLLDSLNAAIENKHMEISKLLIEAGALALQKPNDEKVREALYHAVDKGLTDIVKMIIEKAPYIDVNDYDGKTPLMAAIYGSDVYGDVETFKLLMGAGADLDKQTDYPDFDGYDTISINTTPLLYAISYGQVTICKLLVEAGADLDKQNKDGFTALIEAAKKGNDAICDILLTAGADTNITCVYREMDNVCNRDRKVTACDIATYHYHNEPCRKVTCHIATYHYHNEIISVFEKHGETSNIDIRKELKSAVKDNSIDIVKKIIEERPDVDVDDFYSTPLMSATQKGRLEMCKLLVEAGADPLNIRSRPVDIYNYEYKDYSPLKYATQVGNTAKVKMFLEKLPNVSATEERHVEIVDSLVIALDYRSTEICKFLIEAGALKNPDDKKIREALYEASIQCIFKMILENAPNIDVNDYEGDTPLMAAARNGNVENCKLLIEAGADLDKQNEYGYTALMEAAKRGYDDICNILLTAGAELDKQNEDGLTALILAAIKGHDHMCDILLTAGADANIKCVDKEICRLDNREEKITACDISTYYRYDKVVGVFEKHGVSATIKITDYVDLAD